MTKSMMLPYAVAVLAAAVLAAAPSAVSAAAACAPECTCLLTVMSCSNKGLTELPRGHYPAIMLLDVSSNAISNLDDLGQRFPSLNVLRMRDNRLTTLDINAIAGSGAPIRLMMADFTGNLISRVIPPRSGVLLSEFSTLVLTSNRITALDRDTFRALPNFQHLALNDNPLVVPAKQPFLTHHLLKELDLSRVDASALSERTFAELPSLATLSLQGSAVRDISGVFKELQTLDTLYLESNEITEITMGIFPQTRTLQHLSLDRNPLLHIDTQALPVKDGGELAIEDTPLSCECAHAEVTRWAAQHRVTLSADCHGFSNCHFH